MAVYRVSHRGSGAPCSNRVEAHDATSAARRFIEAWNPAESPVGDSLEVLNTETKAVSRFELDVEWRVVPQLREGPA